MSRVLGFVVLAVSLAVLLPSPAAGRESLRARWIVQLEPGAQLGAVTSTARARHGVTPGQRFSNVMRGFAATMTWAQRDALAADPRVRAIVSDQPVWSTGAPYPLNPDEVQPGIRRVGATANAQRSDVDEAGELDVDIAVLDTGMQPDNAELNVVGGYNCTDSTETEQERRDPANWRDAAFFGHGTHVAGIAAAREDGRGVTGVAQGARLWAIKVLSGSGNGYWSWVICGLDYVASLTEQGQPGVPLIEVVNMSLASAGVDDGDCGHANSDLFHQAVCRLADAGVTMVAAAGNASRDAAGYIPGAYDEVITVSAMTDWNGLADGVASPPAAGSPPEDCTRNFADDAFANFSNFGPDADLIAPGVCVLSTLPPFAAPQSAPRLGLMSGTSMATPHVAGGAALYHLAEAAAGRPRPSPQQVRAALRALGTKDWLTLTDPDRGRPKSEREPALDVSDFSLPPSFEIGLDRQIVRAAAGSSVDNTAWVARIHGFHSAVAFDVADETLPAGASASVDGAAITVQLPLDAIPGKYDVTVTGAAGATTEQAVFRLIVFDDVADPGGPVMSIRSGEATGAVAIPVRITWPAVAKAKRYHVQRSVDGGEWVTLGKPYKRGKNASATPGMRYQHRVRAKVGGIWRSWMTGPSGVVAAFDPGTSIDLDGAWTQAQINAAYSELPVYSTQAGARATFTFSGRSVGWIGSRGPARGRAQVRIDGVLVATIDLYASRNRHRRLLFSQAWSSTGEHTLRIYVLGRPAGRPRVDVDAIVIVSS